MIRALRYLLAAATLAAALGFWGWAGFALAFVLAPAALLFDLSAALAGAALLAGILAVVFWSALSILRVERDMREVLDRLPAMRVAGPYLAGARGPRLVVDNRAAS